VKALFNGHPCPHGLSGCEPQPPLRYCENRLSWEAVRPEDLRRKRAGIPLAMTNTWLLNDVKQTTLISNVKNLDIK